MSAFVLLHGAWHGGWCWARVANILRARGHVVTTPTQTGVGERAHLLSADITLTTFCEDLHQHLLFEDLSDVVLVGHSFGGNALSYAAEIAPDRISRLVYLDAMIVEAGETPLDTVAPDIAALRRQMAQDSSGGLTLPAPPAVTMGVTDRADVAWLESKMTPHPFATFTTPLPIQGAPGGALPAEYIMCTAPEYEPLRESRARARALGWRMRGIAAGHDMMVTAPETLADMLEVPA
ncbi:MAG: alpha/beta hydrolase [Pikeienuella sp.]